MKDRTHEVLLVESLKSIIIPFHDIFSLHFFIFLKQMFSNFHFIVSYEVHTALHALPLLKPSLGHSFSLFTEDITCICISLFSGWVGVFRSAPHLHVNGPVLYMFWDIFMKEKTFAICVFCLCEWIEENRWSWDRETLLIGLSEGYIKKRTDSVKHRHTKANVYGLH